MRSPFILLFGLFLLTAAVFVPREVYAIGLSFGGQLVSQPTPCVNLPGTLGFLIRPAGRFPFAYVWAPGTLGLPPYRIGQYILGIYDVPLVCNGVPAFRVQRSAIGL